MKSPTHGLPQASVLLLWLVALTLYRMWVIPRLGITLYVDEAQYWTWSQSLDWGYFSKPPVIAWLIAACTALFGNGMLAVKLPALILYPATSWLLFLLGRQLFDARTGFRIGVAFSLMPLVSALGLFVSTDAPLLFFWTASMLYFVRALDSNRWRDWLLLGLCAGLGLMSKYTMGAFAASALLYLLVDRRRWPLLGHTGLWIAAFVALLVFLPNMWWNWAHDFPTLRHTADITHVDGINTKTGNLGEFLGDQVISLGPLFALAFIGGAVMALRQWRETRMQFLLCFSLPLLLLVVAQAARAEANGNWAAPALVGALALAVVWLMRLHKRWWALALGLNIVLMLTVYHINQGFALAGRQLPARVDLLKRARGWDTLAAQLRPILAANPDVMLVTDDRTFMAHLRYELRDLPFDHASWAPFPHAQDHYQLTEPLDASHAARRILLVTRNADEQIVARFAHHQLLAVLHVATGQTTEITANVILLDGFKGYR